MAEPLWGRGGLTHLELSVGVLAADPLNLGRDLDRLSRAAVRAVHFDVMDGRFCPDFTVGPWFVGAVKTQLVKDVHLLVAEPMAYIEPCVLAGAGIITVHLESDGHVHRALEIIPELADAHGMPSPLRGIGLCPGTPTSAVEPFLDVADVVYVLGINPGWRQGILKSTGKRVAAVREMLERADRHIRIAVDGGVTLDNLTEVASWHPDLVVSGSAVFAHDKIEENLARFARARVRVGEPQADQI